MILDKEDGLAWLSGDSSGSVIHRRNPSGVRVPPPAPDFMSRKKKLKEVEEVFNGYKEPKKYPRFEIGLRPWLFRPWIEHFYYNGNIYTLNLGWFYICYFC